MKKRFRFLLAVCAILFGPGAFLFIFSQEMSYLNWALPVVGILWLVLLALWYACFGEAPLRQRLFRVLTPALVIALLAIAGTALFRYEGSASGSSFPRFSWVWQEEGAGRGAAEGVSTLRTERSREAEELHGAAADVPDFMGPERNGIWPELSFDPDWAENPPELLWRRPMGIAWSSFTVSGARAVTFEQIEDTERVTCLNLFTGEELWHHDEPATRLLLLEDGHTGGQMGGDGPRSTPVIHGGKVFSAGSTGIVNCLDFETGEVIWKRQVIEEFTGGIQRWGQANSPLVIAGEGTVVVPGSDREGDTLVAFDLNDGATRWVYEGEGASYSSPRILEYFGIPLLVSVNAHDATGHDPASGEVRWRYPWRGAFPKVGQPLKVGADQLFLSASYGVGSPLLELALDGEEWTVRELWRSTRMKTKFSSAIVLGEHIYGLDEGRLACVDLATGNRVWKNQKFGYGQHLLFGEHLLVQAESGDIVVGRIGPEAFVEISRLKALDSMTWNVPVVAGRLLLARNDREAACYLLPALR